MYVDPDPECHEEGWGAARSTAIPVAAVVAFGGSYMMTYGVDQYLTYTEFLGPYGEVLQFGVIVGLVVLHEAIHVLAYLLVGDLAWDDIEVEVELDFEEGRDPIHHSVHPVRPIHRWVYYIGVGAPGLILGIVPSSVALATGNPLAMFVGLVGLLLVSTDIGVLITAWRHPESMVVSGTTS